MLRRLRNEENRKEKTRADRTEWNPSTSANDLSRFTETVYFLCATTLVPLLPFSRCRCAAVSLYPCNRSRNARSCSTTSNRE